MIVSNECTIKFNINIWLHSYLSSYITATTYREWSRPTSEEANLGVEKQKK